VAGPGARRGAGSNRAQLRLPVSLHSSQLEFGDTGSTGDRARRAGHRSRLRPVHIRSSLDDLREPVTAIDAYTSTAAITIVSVAFSTAIGSYLIADRREVRQLGITLLILSGAWLAGLLFSNHWLAFGLVFAVAESHQVAYLLYKRRAHTQPPDGELQVRAITRADQYNAAIEELEAPAHRVVKTLQRFNTVFKDEELSREVARQRYGDGSPLYRTYVSTHGRRRQEFFLKLENGKLHHREILSLVGIREWLREPVHPAALALRRELIVRQVRNVIDTLHRFPHNYGLALSEEEHPFRYAVIDGRTVVLHEAIGATDMHRVNSLFITEESTVTAFEEEFELVWQRIDESLRSNSTVALKLEELLEQSPEPFADVL
jgi:hypothetical protein